MMQTTWTDMMNILSACNKITATKSVRPELRACRAVEGQPFMVRQAHHERQTVPPLLLQALTYRDPNQASAPGHNPPSPPPADETRSGSRRRGVSPSSPR